MKENQINRLLKLVKKTGDKLVVLDEASDHATVMLSLDSYEYLVDQGPDLGWHSTSEGIPPVIPQDDVSTEETGNAGPTSALESSGEAREASESDDAYLSIAKEEATDEVDSHGAIPEYITGKKRLDFSANWAVENAKPISEDDLKDVPEEEEEKFYLEPVE